MGYRRFLQSRLTLGLPDVPILELGRRLGYGEAGFGEDLVLVHGSPGDGRSWARVIRELPSNVRALTPDLPGYGGSDPLSCDAADRTQAIADDIGALIRQRAEPVWLCGHSYGGNVALHAALAHNERVKGLLLIEPVFIRGLELANEQEVLVKTRAYFTNYMIRVAFAEPNAVSMMVDFWFGNGAFAKMPSSAQRFLNDAAHLNVEDVQATLSERIVATQFAELNQRVLIAVGEASPSVTWAIAKALVTFLPNGRTIAVRGAGHGMLDSHPQEVARLLGELRSTTVNIER